MADMQAVVAAQAALAAAAVGSEAAAQAAWELSDLAARPVNQNAIRDAGGIPLLVKLLAPAEDAEVESADTLGDSTKAAVDALCRLAENNALNQNAFRDAGAISPVVETLTTAATLEAAVWMAWALRHLATKNTQNQDAIREACGIPPLVDLLIDAAEDWETEPQTAEGANAAAATLGSLADSNPANSVAICEAGGLPPLVALLRSWHPLVKATQFHAAQTAASALCTLTPMRPAAVVDAVAAADPPPPLEEFSDLQQALRVAEAALRLERAVVEGESDEALIDSLTVAVKIGVAEEDLWRGIIEAARRALSRI
jgi:hypothetical protein